MRGQIQDIEPEQIHLAIKERVLEQSAESVPEYGKAVDLKTKRGVIKPRTPNQAQYMADLSTMTFFPSALARRVRVKPTWQWLRQLMPWSVRKFAVFC